MRRAKIVYTLGPAVNAIDRLVQLISAEINVARLNVSHRDYDEREGRLGAVRGAARVAGRTVGVLADLQRSKIRPGKFVDDQKHYLERGDRFTITIEDVLGTKECCSTTFKSLPGDVKPGDQVLIDDDKAGLRALEVPLTRVLCKVVIAGPAFNNKGINLPGIAVSVPAISERGEWDLRWALPRDIDMIALSFIRNGGDIKRVHEIVEGEGHRIPVTAKLEKPQTITNLQEIVDAFDAFMIARGDLRVEPPLEGVPPAQKQIIRMACKWTKPVIVAAQILEFMISPPRPTRVEASDMMNTILDSAGGMMLSGETSVDDYPVETVQTMARVVEATEHDGHTEVHAIDWDPHTIGGILTHMVVKVTRRVGARYLVVFTKPGGTVRWLFRLCPSIPPLVFAPEVTTQQAMTLTWGVETHITPNLMVQEQMVETVDAFFWEQGMIEVGGRTVILFGSPIGTPGRTSNPRVHKVKAKGEIDA